MLLGQPVAEHPLEHRAQRHPWVAEQPRGQLGVEHQPGPVPDLGQAGQVLRRGVQHRLDAAERGVDAD